MRPILRKCLNCGAYVTDVPEVDSLGYYMYCPKCEGTFDVDVIDRDELLTFLQTRINKNMIFDEGFKNEDVFTYKILVNRGLYNIFNVLFHPMDEMLFNNGSYQPYIEILYDADYDLNKNYDDKAFLIELHQYNNVIRITDLMLCQYIKDKMKELIEENQNQK